MCGLLEPLCLFKDLRFSFLAVLALSASLEVVRLVHFLIGSPVALHQLRVLLQSSSHLPTKRRSPFPSSLSSTTKLPHACIAPTHFSAPPCGLICTPVVALRHQCGFRTLGLDVCTSCRDPEARGFLSAFRRRPTIPSEIG